jgi:galactose-1-phosphate uridylyltransferase
MSDFVSGMPNTVELGMGTAKTAEEREEEKKSAERDREIIDNVLAEQKKVNDAANFAERQRAISRAAGLLKSEVVKIVMRENPNFDEADAKHLFETELKKLIAVERFKTAFFGSPDKQREMFSHVEM